MTEKLAPKLSNSRVVQDPGVLVGCSRSNWTSQVVSRRLSLINDCADSKRILLLCHSKALEYQDCIDMADPAFFNVPGRRLRDMRLSEKSKKLKADWTDKKSKMMPRCVPRPTTTNHTGSLI